MKLFASPLIWIGAALAAAGLVLWKSSSGSSSDEAPEPKLNSVPATYVPTAAECDWAYTLVPQWMQQQYENAIGDASDTGTTNALEGLLASVVANPTLDPKVRSYFAACIRKGIKVAKNEPLTDGSTPAPTYGGNAGFVDESDDSPSYDADFGNEIDQQYESGPYAPTYDFSPNNFAPQAPSYDPVAILGGFTPLGQSTPDGDWPAINALPNGPLKTEALQAVGGVKYAALFSGEVSPCLNNGGYCTSAITLAVVHKLQVADLGFMTAGLKQAAIIELQQATGMLQGRGL